MESARREAARTKRRRPYDLQTGLGRVVLADVKMLAQSISTMRTMDCKILIDWRKDTEELSYLISNLTGGILAIKTVCSDDFEIDVIRNDDYNPSGTNDEDGFLYFSHYCEIYRAQNTAKADSIDLVTTISRNLKAMSVRVVPACDFENELPDDIRFKA